MARGASGWILPILLLGASGGLGWLIYQELQAAPAGIVPASSTNTSPSLPELPERAEFSMAESQTFSAIVERPLFSPMRRPPAKGAVTIGAAEPELDVTLVGVIISAEEQIALLKPESTSTILRLFEGDVHKGWTLDLIEPDRVVFRRGEIEEFIRLSFEEPPPAPPKRKKSRRKQDRQNQKAIAPKVQERRKPQQRQQKE